MKILTFNTTYLRGLWHEKYKKSDSLEREKAERIIFENVKKSLGVDLKENAEISVSSTYIKPDFYSEDERIMGEIFAHIGKSKPGQNRKSIGYIRCVVYDFVNVDCQRY